MSAQPAEEPRGMVPRAELYRALARIDDLRAEIVELRKRLGMEPTAYLCLQRKLNLTRGEAQILAYLVAHKDVARRTLYAAIYDDTPDAPEIKILDVYTSKLRKKLAAANAPENWIETIWGSGWRISDEGRAWLEAIIEGGK
jgi:hypothetical protein